MLAQRRERLDHLRQVRGCLDIGVEDVLPRPARSRPGLELRQVQVALGERTEAAVQRAGDVADSEDERRLARLAERRRVARERAEARVVVRVGLDPLRQHLESVQLGSAPGCDGGGALEPILRDALRRSGGVVLRAHGHVERAEELLALRDRLWMRDNLTYVVDRRSRQREQEVVDAYDRFADEVEAVPQKEVVRLVDAARLRVVHRDEPPAGTADLDRFEHRADGRERAMLGIGEERERALLRVRAGLALIRDDVHPQSLWSVRSPRWTRMTGSRGCSSSSGPRSSRLRQHTEDAGMDSYRRRR